MVHSWGAGIVATLLALHGWPVYLLITALGFAEAAAFLGLVLPGETALLLGGVLAAQGNISLTLLIVLAVVAAIAGDSAGYEIGRWLGPSMKDCRVGRWIGPARWARAEDALTHRGSSAVFLGRWVGVLRALVPAVAGAAGMPYRKFLVANAVGGVLWAFSVAILGFWAAAAWTQVQGWLGLASVVAAVLVVTWCFREWRRGRATGSSSGPVSDGADPLAQPADASG